MFAAAAKLPSLASGQSLADPQACVEVWKRFSGLHARASTHLQHGVSLKSVAGVFDETRLHLINVATQRFSNAICPVLRNLSDVLETDSVVEARLLLIKDTWRASGADTCRIRTRRDGW